MRMTFHSTSAETCPDCPLCTSCTGICWESVYDRVIYGLCIFDDKKTLIILQHFCWGTNQSNYDGGHWCTVWLRSEKNSLKKHFFFLWRHYALHSLHMPFLFIDTSVTAVVINEAQLTSSTRAHTGNCKQLYSPSTFLQNWPSLHIIKCYLPLCIGTVLSSHTRGMTLLPLLLMLKEGLRSYSSTETLQPNCDTFTAKALGNSVREVSGKCKMCTCIHKSVESLQVQSRTQIGTEKTVPISRPQE